MTRRRLFLRHTAHLVAGSLPLLATAARASVSGARSLSLVHTHTHERIELVYAVEERYDPFALALLNRFLRDHYSGEVGRIDPRVFDQLHRLRLVLGQGAGTFEVISGYRCPATNDRLRETRSGGVARHSLHIEGRAIDVRGVLRARAVRAPRHRPPAQLVMRHHRPCPSWRSMRELPVHTRPRAGMTGAAA
jgi:uncharacterized protein YcbK (DUF882 family)